MDSSIQSTLMTAATKEKLTESLSLLASHRFQGSRMVRPSLILARLYAHSQVPLSASGTFAFWNPGVYNYQKTRVEQVLAEKGLFEPGAESAFRFVSQHILGVVECVQEQE